MKIIYDGDCIFCNRYKDYVLLRASFDVTVIDARESHEIVSELRHQGLDINQGFIISFNGKYYQGPLAILLIQKLLGRWTWLPTWSLKAVYPLIKMMRLLALKLSGKSSRLN